MAPRFGSYNSGLPFSTPPTVHRIAFVVPTLNRPDDLRRMLASLVAQTRRPDQVIVVDASEPPVREVAEGFPALQVDYVREFPPSLARQRNAGMARVRSDIALAGYLDDDIVLEPRAVQSMLEFWEAAGPDVGGAAFNITNNPAPGGLAVKRLFGVDDARPGRMLRSGCPSTIPPQRVDLETDWLYGGATVWRRAVIEAYPYDEWFVGTGFMEDIDFSYNVRERYRMVVVAGARLAHYSRPVRPDRQYLLGKWQVVNRMHIVRKYHRRGLSPAAAWYASAGLVLLNLAAALARASRAHWDRARGNAAGIVSELFGRREQLGGHLK
jgi:glycosyltransferase involved in cell wall biosynthesis